MDAYAVVETGGKQYRVKAGDRIRVERLRVDVGASFEIRPVLAVSDGKKLEIGTPEVEGVKVASVVVEHVRGDKVVSFKQKRRKGFSKKIGHRQELTVLKVEKIGKG
jgi:large subunit ribosomal protein L21